MKLKYLANGSLKLSLALSFKAGKYDREIVNKYQKITIRSSKLRRFSGRLSSKNHHPDHQQGGIMTGNQNRVRSEPNRCLSFKPGQSNRGMTWSGREEAGWEAQPR